MDSLGQGRQLRKALQKAIADHQANLKQKLVMAKKETEKQQKLAEQARKQKEEDRTKMQADIIENTKRGIIFNTDLSKITGAAQEFKGEKSWERDF